MPELAKAYVQIIPSAEGIKGKLADTLGEEAESAGESSAGSFGAGFAKAVGTVAKVGAAAIGAAATAAGKMVKDAVTSYAEYEQLVGGIETLFEDLSVDVGINAAAAYKTAGLSANEYMETAMSFAASLNQSLLSTEGKIARAADLTDQAVIDMADNANKMGTDMSAIQAAYQGFAKQNYTMLDNLKLGYGGTKTEMERLLADATALSGVEYDINSYADIIEAIHTVQEELGISGTTAKEAGETISGSLAMTKSAWDNLVTGIANPDADIGALISDVVDSATVAAGNLIPAIETGLSGVGQLITGLAPVITGALPSLISSVLPGLFSTAQSLVVSVAEALIQNLPLMAETGISMLTQLATGISEALPDLIPVAVDAILALVETLTNPDSIGQLADAAIEITLGLANGIISALPNLIEKAPVIITNLVSAIVQNVPRLIEAAFEVVGTLVKGIVQYLPELGKAAGDIVGTILKGLADLWVGFLDAGRNIVAGIWEGIKGAGDWLWSQVKGFFTGIVDGVKSVLGIASPSKVFAGIGENMALGLGTGFDDTMAGVERDMMRAIPVPAMDVAAVGSYRFGGPSEAGLRSGSADGGVDDVISAVMAVGNMIVTAVREIDPDIQLDGVSLANRMYRYNQEAAQRIGPAMVV